jgi:membrane-bound lytic murein transglycosylase A
MLYCRRLRIRKKSNNFEVLKLISIGLGLFIWSSDRLLAEKIPLQKAELKEQRSNLVRDEKLWQTDKQALVQSIDNSLLYLGKPSAKKAYQDYPIEEFKVDRVRRSLLRFRELLLTCVSSEEFEAAIEREFVFYKSIGNDNLGNVDFTGYFEPSYRASLTPTAEYRYPIYRKPSNFQKWSKPHPKRIKLEGKDGLLGQKSILSGYELVWLRDRMEAVLIQVQGSAKLQLTDGSTMTVGYDGSTNYAYSSLGKELVKDGKFKLEELTLPLVIDYFRANPSELDEYISRNDRFIFFRDTQEMLPTGSLSVSVTPDRSIATDKSIMPPGALALVRTNIPEIDSKGKLTNHFVNRYVLDQDTGSAIKGAGRVDIFLGSGKIAGDRAGMLNSKGELYYLLLKE